MKKRWMAVFAAAMIIFGIGGNIKTPLVAYAAKEPNLVVGEEGETEFILTPGEVKEVHVPVIAQKQFVWEPEFEVILPKDAPFEIQEIDVYHLNGAYHSDDNHISSVKGAYISFFIVTKETAKAGKYEFSLEYTDKGRNGVIMPEGDFDKTLTFTGIVNEEKLPAELTIQKLKISGDMKPGGTATVSFELTNVGEVTAKGVRLAAEFGSGMLIPNYTDYTKKLGDLKEAEAAKVSLSVRVMESVAQSVVILPLRITYKDIDGVEYEADSNNVLYLNVELPEEPKEEDKPDLGTLLINNVKQNPANPKAGEAVSLTFDMTNTGEKAYTDVKLFPNYVSGTGFEPVKAEPYQAVGTLKAGQKKSVTVNLVAGKNMAGGMNAFTMNYTYENFNKEEVSGSTTFYVLNIQEKKDESKEEVVVSRPKLMVTEFSTSKEVVKSGEEFDFTFRVYNTHSKTAANNIKITVSSEQFSVTKGSNSFFTQKIGAGSFEEFTINLKASAAAMTGSYPINIQMEYEYDGMPASEANAGGVVVTETKMLLIKENLRVSVENVMVGGWSTPYVNQTTQLAFSIYNMGKSTLNNVYFTVEGDFAVANGSSYYYGMLQSGYPDYVEMDIMPLVAGEAKGVLTIHMEDSNGDEVTYTSDISGFIMEQGGGDVGFVDPGFDIPVDVPPVSGGGEPAKPIVSLPVFIAIMVIVFLASFFITRGIRIACYKKKAHRDA